MNILKELAEISFSGDYGISIDRIMEQILDVAMELEECDAGTIYVVENDLLEFKVMRNRHLKEYNGNGLALKPVSICSKVNLCALSLQQGIINIPDVYSCEDYDLSGTKSYDKQTGYHTKSVLVIPIIIYPNRAIAVLQLINAIDTTTGEIISFSEEKLNIAKILSTQLSSKLQIYMYEQEMVWLKQSLQIDTNHITIPEEERAGLSAYVAQNYYGRMTEEELDYAVKRLDSKENREKLQMKKKRQKQDAIEQYIACTTEETAKQLEKYVADNLEKDNPSTVSQLLHKYMDEYMNRTGATQKEIALKACIDAGALNYMYNNKRQFKKYHIIATAIALGLTLEQVNEVLRAGFMYFKGSLQKDIVLQYFIQLNEKRMRKYDVRYINEVLLAMGLDAIGSKTVDKE